MKESTALLVIVVAFGIGVLVGAMANRSPIIVQPDSQRMPSNYDPGRAIAEDALKSAQASAERCWSHLIDERAKDAHH